MPPPPALRCSPGRDLRGERPRSFGSGLSFKEKEDDGLALFDEMQKKENDNFLLESNDDFEDLFEGTKLKYFSGCKIELSISARGENSDMLDAIEEKNDYDWLLTPPDTPLFPTLDDEAPPGNIVPRGRPCSLPIAISRSNTMEKSYKGRSGRGSLSPQRFSPSPRPGTGSSHQSRGRTSPAPSSSPTPSVRNPSPSRKPSPPSIKSSKPTPRRLSTESSGAGASLHGRGSSPVQSSRGISSSPKVSAWQSNNPGFSTEVPPNLRTSLADRPASYARGSSPASRNGKDLPTKVKLSMSPTDHKSVTSSVSHDRGQLSSCTKGYMVSSGDDDVESESSMSIPNSTSEFSRRVGTQSNKKALSYSKKPYKMVSSVSAPKRSFDYALRHMDQRKNPQNMFRPLLSSVPTTTLYAGKPMSAQEAMFSKSSSMATSTTASSDQAAGLAPEMEERYTRYYSESQYYKPSIDIPEEVLVLDKLDGLHFDAVTETGSLRIQHESTDEHDDDADFSYNNLSTTVGAVSKVESNASDGLEEGATLDMELCTECGCKYNLVDISPNDVNLCPECSRSDSNLQVCYPEKSVSKIYPGTYLNHPDNQSPQFEPEEYPALSEYVDLATICNTESMVSHCEDIASISEPSFKENTNSVKNLIGRSFVDEGDRRHMIPQVVCHRRVGSGQVEVQDRGQFMFGSDTSSSYFNDSEVDGISILLKRSSSSKGPIYQGGMFKASSIPYDDPSYGRESGSFTRSSMGLGSTSASTSVDLSSTGQIETRIQRQSSIHKTEMGAYRLKRTGSCSSETSNHAYQTSCHSLNTHDDESEVFGCNEYNMEDELSCLQEKFHTSGSIEIEEMAASRSYSFKETPGRNIVSCRSSATSNNEKSSFYEHGEAMEKIHLMTDGNMLPSASQPAEDLPLQQNFSDAEKPVEVYTHRSLHSVSEIENELEQENNYDSENDNGSTKLDGVVADSHTQSVNIEGTNVEEADLYNTECDFSESAVLIQCQRGNHVRSLTLEEATDTILFCRSLVESIADQAATIAVEKERPPPRYEPPRLILSKTNPQRKESRSKTPNNKPKQKRTQTEDHKPQFKKSENVENDEQSFPRNVGLPNKPDAARPLTVESKCNCTIM